MCRSSRCQRNQRPSAFGLCPATNAPEGTQRGPDCDWRRHRRMRCGAGCRPERTARDLNRGNGLDWRPVDTTSRASRRAPLDRDFWRDQILPRVSFANQRLLLSQLPTDTPSGVSPSTESWQRKRFEALPRAPCGSSRSRTASSTFCQRTSVDRAQTAQGCLRRHRL